MNKTKKGLLTASSIITIVACAFAILGSFVLFLIGSVFTEELMKESYMTDPEYTYFEDANGDYHFTYIEDGVEMIIYDDDIAMVAKVAKIAFIAVGCVSLGLGVAKLVLGIRILYLSGQEKYGKGSVIALLVLSLVSSNLLEAVLLIAAMCQKDEPKIDDKKDDISNSDVILTDITNE